MQAKINRTAVYALAIVVILTGSFVYRGRNKVGVVEKNAKVNAQKLAEDYKNGVKEVWSEYQAIESSPKKEDILNLRDKLLELTVPSEFREAHLDFTIGLSLLEEGLKAGSDGLAEKGRKRIEKFKQDNLWLAF